MEFDVTTLHGRRADRRWNRMVVGDVLERLTWSDPDRDAVVGREGAFGDPAFERMTYREADGAADRVAHALLAAGLRRSDRVLLLCGNSVEALLTMLGVAKAGLVAVPVDPSVGTEVLAWAIDHVGATTAVVDAGAWPDAEASFTAAGLSPVATITIGGGPVAGSPSFQDWIARHPSGDPDVEPRLHADDVWCVRLTSGTTAAPKASMVTHAASYLSATSYVPSLTRGLRHEDDLRLLSFLPVVSHCAHDSAYLPAFFAGGTAIVGRAPEPRAVAEAISEERVTAVWAGAPTYLRAVADVALADPDRLDLTSLTVGMCSWGRIDPEGAATVAAACGDVQVLEVFGLTEAMAGYRYWPARDPEHAAPGSEPVNRVGRPAPIVGARIVDVDGASLHGVVGTPGEVVHRSPVVTAGYFRDEAATAKAFSDGWFHSGDACAYLEDGTQAMVDRVVDLVPTGDGPVASLRVENVLTQHPAVLAAAVVGTRGDEHGEVLTAVVEVVPGHELDPGGLVAFAREHLDPPEVPGRIEVVDALPRTLNGKVLKRVLRDRLAAGAAGAPRSEDGISAGVAGSDPGRPGATAEPDRR